MTTMIIGLDRGDRRRVRVEFTDLNGTLADPTVVTLRARRPDPAANLAYVYDGTLLELTRVSAGVYEKAITFDTSGRWSLRAEAEGAVVAATSPVDVQVSDDPFEPA